MSALKTQGKEPNEEFSAQDCGDLGDIRLLVPVLVGLASFLGGAASSIAASSDELIIRFRSDISFDEQKELLGRYGLVENRSLVAELNLRVVKLRSDRGYLRGLDSHQVVKELESNAEIVYAEPNRTVKSNSAGDDDRYFAQQWALANNGHKIVNYATEYLINGVPYLPNPDFEPGRISGEPNADIQIGRHWNRRFGGEKITVAVVDSGADRNHPDLRGRVVEGRNMTDEQNSQDMSDMIGHGTHIAGIIAANNGNDEGIAGINPNAQILPAKVKSIEVTRSPDGDRTSKVATRLDDVIKGYVYAATHGAKIINISSGMEEYSRAEYETIKSFPHTLFVTSSGNDGIDVDNGFKAQYPCSYSLGNILCVAATDQNDIIAIRAFFSPLGKWIPNWMSNYGSQSVDLAAPGVNILSTYTCSKLSSDDRDCPRASFQGYAYQDGTSSAAAIVSGIASLLWSQFPDADLNELKNTLIATVDPKLSLSGKTVSGGRVNADAAWDLMEKVRTPVPPVQTNSEDPDPKPNPQPPPNIISPLAIDPPKLSPVTIGKTVKLDKKHRNAKLLVSCNQAQQCKLKVVLYATKKIGKKRRKSRYVVIGKTSKIITAHTTRSIKIKIRNSARQLVSSRKKLKGGIRIGLGEAQPPMSITIVP